MSFLAGMAFAFMWCATTHADLVGTVFFAFLTIVAMLVGLKGELSRG